MLSALGVDDIDALIAQVVPEAIRQKAPLELDAPVSEDQALREIRELADHNQVRRSLIGMGYYDTLTPTVIQRCILEDPGWYTQYTPYQAEIAQGRLEALLNFQTMVIELTGLPRSPTARCSTRAPPPPRRWRCACHDAGRKQQGSQRASSSTPATATRRRSTSSATRAEPLGIEVHEVGDAATCELRPPRRAGHRRRLLQYPGPSGEAVADHDAAIGARFTRSEGAGRGRARRTCWRSRCSRPAGRAGRRHRRRQQPALRRAARLRRPARGLHVRGIESLQAPRCRAASSASARRQSTAGPAYAPRARRPASSTSVARRPRPTSARRRCCWRSWPRCTPCTTGRTGLRRIASASRLTRARWPMGCAAAWATVVLRTSTYFDTLRLEPGPMPAEPIIAAARSRASTCAQFGSTAASASRSTRRSSRGSGRPAETASRGGTSEAAATSTTLRRGPRSIRRCRSRARHDAS